MAEYEWLVCLAIHNKFLIIFRNTMCLIFFRNDFGEEKNESEPSEALQPMCVRENGEQQQEIWVLLAYHYSKYIKCVSCNKEKTMYINMSYCI